MKSSTMIINRFASKIREENPSMTEKEVCKRAKKKATEFIKLLDNSLVKENGEFVDIVGFEKIETTDDGLTFFKLPKI